MFIINMQPSKTCTTSQYIKIYKQNTNDDLNGAGGECELIEIHIRFELDHPLDNQVGHFHSCYVNQAPAQVDSLGGPENFNRCLISVRLKI